MGVGLLLGWITLKSERLEPALGLHAANNLYASWMVTFAGSSLPVPTLFTIQKYDPAVGLLLFAVSVAGFLVMYYLLPAFRRKSAPESVTGGHPDEN